VAEEDEDDIEKIAAPVAVIAGRRRSYAFDANDDLVLTVAAGPAVAVAVATVGRTEIAVAPTGATPARFPHNQ
jgi:hypothetical protein